MSLVSPLSWRPRAASACIGPLASCSAFGADSSASQSASACSSSCVRVTGSMKRGRALAPAWRRQPRIGFFAAVGAASAAPLALARASPVTSPVPRPQVPLTAIPILAASGVARQPAGELAWADPGEDDVEAGLRAGRRRGAELPDDPVRQRGVEPVAQHPELQRVEELVDLVAAPRHGHQVCGPDVERARSCVSSVSRRFRSTLPRFSRRLSPALPLTWSTLSTSAAVTRTRRPTSPPSSRPRQECQAGCRSGRRAAPRSRGTAPGSARTSPAPPQA